MGGLLLLFALCMRVSIQNEAYELEGATRTDPEGLLDNIDFFGLASFAKDARESPACVVGVRKNEASIEGRGGLCCLQGTKGECCMASWAILDWMSACDCASDCVLEVATAGAASGVETARSLFWRQRSSYKSGSDLTREALRGEAHALKTCL